MEDVVVFLGYVGFVIFALATFFPLARRFKAFSIAFFYATVFIIIKNTALNIAGFKHEPIESQMLLYGLGLILSVVFLHVGRRDWTSYLPFLAPHIAAGQWTAIARAGVSKKQIEILKRLSSEERERIASLDLDKSQPLTVGRAMKDVVRGVFRTFAVIALVGAYVYVLGDKNAAEHLLAFLFLAFVFAMTQSAAHASSEGTDRSSVSVKDGGRVGDGGFRDHLDDLNLSPIYSHLPGNAWHNGPFNRI